MLGRVTASQTYPVDSKRVMTHGTPAPWRGRYLRICGPTPCPLGQLMQFHEFAEQVRGQPQPIRTRGLADDFLPPFSYQLGDRPPMWGSRRWPPGSIAELIFLGIFRSAAASFALSGIDGWGEEGMKGGRTRKAQVGLAGQYGGSGASQAHACGLASGGLLCFLIG